MEQPEIFNEDDIKPKTGMDSEVEEEKEYKLIKNDAWTKAVAEAWDRTGVIIPFAHYTPQHQRRMLSFARRVRKLDVEPPE